ncbi:helix-turn-helix domain-containing protein [Massilia rhizosphaerae]|uniref:helix-turn-helix domain-containing protein n=1 Tax=Massilia rhizosphaerae TaxID=2784389 RepID=UPI0018DAFA05|nr:helix-turn-helix domain-containing protein [Massilia rhizosphaerae]
MEQKLYKVATVMQRLGVCRATIYRMAKRGDLELVRIGSATRITGSSIDRLIGTSTLLPAVRPDEEAALVTQSRESAKPRGQRSRCESKEDLERRIAALEHEVAALRTLITKFKEATDECTKTFPAPAGRHRTGR